MISKIISSIFCNKEVFDKAAPVYNNALKNSGFNEKVKFTPPPPQKRKRSRNIIWSNLPFRSNVKTNTGKIFWQLLDNHFPKHY